MDREAVFTAAAEHRREVADLLESLDEARLATPSLCAGWDVRTVGAHLAGSLTDSVARFLLLSLRRGSVHRASEELTRRRARQPITQITGTLRAHADRRKSPPGTGPLAPLTDVVVHEGDIRIPLGLPFAPDPAHASLALDFLTGPRPVGFVPRGRLPGLALRATDLDRGWGEGVEVRGPVAALMMAACGRPAVLGALDGPGLPLLRDRLTAGAAGGGQVGVGGT